MKNALLTVWFVILASVMSAFFIYQYIEDRQADKYTCPDGLWSVYTTDEEGAVDFKCVDPSKGPVVAGKGARVEAP